MMLFHGGRSLKDNVSDGVGEKEKKERLLNPFQWKSSKVINASKENAKNGDCKKTLWTGQ